MPTMHQAPCLDIKERKQELISSGDETTVKKNKTTLGTHLGPIKS